jgi:signal transduction histidine kinase
LAGGAGGPTGSIRWVVGSDGAVRYAAAGTSGALGIDPAGLVGEAWDARLHPADRGALRELLGRRRDDAGAVARVTARFAGPDGWRRFDLSAASAVDDPAIGGIVLDLSPVDDGGRSPAADPFAAEPAATRGTRHGGPGPADVLALVSHEFRTPLTSIQGYSELIAGAVTDPDEVAEFAGIIHQEANRLAQLIDDMLLLDQLASRRIHLNIVETSLNGVVREVVARAEPNAPAHRFALNLHPDLPPVPADRDRLVQMTACLVANAVKFSPGGEIGIRTDRDRKRAILEVSDRGVGIPKEALERIFERFQRVDSAPNRALGGRGLGLSLVREIVRLHGGRVWAESTEGVGSTFRVALPLRASAAAAAD